MLNIVYAIVGAIFMVVMALFAFLKGGPHERLGAAAYLLAWFASLVMQEMQGFRGMPFNVFLIDTALLLTFVGLAWRSRASWPIWASGLQLVAVMGHLMVLTGQKVPLASLYTVTNFISYLIIICIGVGTFWAWQERKAEAEFALGRNS